MCLFPTGSTAQTTLSQLSQDSQRLFPVSNDFPSNTFSFPLAGARCSSRVLNRDVSVCLPDFTVSTGLTSVGCSTTLVNGVALVRSLISKEKPSMMGESPDSVAPSHISGFGLPFTSIITNTKSYTETGLKYAQARGGHAVKSHFIRAPATYIFCTRLNAKICRHNVRLCHIESSSKDLVTDSDHSHQNKTTNTQLTHTDDQGRARMVDVGGKVPVRRTATASATVILGPTAFQLLRDNQLAKGDALAVAQVAGIMASKQTSALIPLCHSLPLDCTSITFDLNELQQVAVITATCQTTARTGVEMEALTAACVAALTVYDMCKAVSHDITITDVQLLNKTGGKRNFNRYPPTPPLNSTPDL